MANKRSIGEWVRQNIVTVIFIIILVQVIQSVFSWLSTKLDKRLR